jgi:5-methyltetrahydrofolate--homocysteine methyltransferase
MGKILTKIEQNGVLVSDGAWGTFLHELGLQAGECPESWNLSRPEEVLKVARGYVEAGADVILTNSFGGSPSKLKVYGFGDKTYEINRAAAEISRKAAGEGVLVLGSVGPTGKMLLTGEITDEEMSEGFRVQARGLADGGADGVLVETMSDIREAELAVTAARSITDLEVACTFTFERNLDGVYRTMMGVTVTEAMEAVVAAGASVIGANCGNGIAGMIDIVKEIRTMNMKLPVLVHANAGLPVYREGKTVFPESPEEMASAVWALKEAGAGIIGGCCGTTPDHIKHIYKALH